MNILFVCTGNSCRSQLAEGWAGQLGGSDSTVQSAGIEAHGKYPRAIAVMQDAGVVISLLESRRLTDDLLANADVLVTVCGHADEHCPAVPGRINKIHWPLQDPAKVTGSEEQIMQVFRASRDDIRRRVQQLLDTLALTS